LNIDNGLAVPALLYLGEVGINMMFGVAGSPPWKDDDYIVPPRCPPGGLARLRTLSRGTNTLDGASRLLEAAEAEA
jgi:hypothetical protein